MNLEILNKFKTEYKNLNSEEVTFLKIIEQSISATNYLAFVFIELSLIYLGITMKSNIIGMLAILFIILYIHYLLTKAAKIYTSKENFSARKAVDKVFNENTYKTDPEALDALIESLEKTDIEETQIYLFLKNDNIIKINKAIWLMYIGIIVANFTSMVRIENVEDAFQDYAYLLHFFMVISVLSNVIYTFFYLNYLKNTRILGLFIKTIEDTRLEKMIKKAT